MVAETKSIQYFWEQNFDQMIAHESNNPGERGVIIVFQTGKCVAYIAVEDGITQIKFDQLDTSHSGSAILWYKNEQMAIVPSIGWKQIL